MSNLQPGSNGEQASEQGPPEILANGTADTEMTDEPIQPAVPHIKHEHNHEASLQTPPSLPLAPTPNAFLQPANPPPVEPQQLTPLNGATSSSSSLNTITYPPTTHIPPPTAPVPNFPVASTHTQPPVAAIRASTPSAGPSAASLLPSAIIPPANPSGSPTRVYLNQKVTPVLLEGMKWIAANEPAKPLKWLSEYLAKKSLEVEGS